MKANRTFFDPTLVGYEASFANATPGVAERRWVAYEKMKVIAVQAANAGCRSSPAPTWCSGKGKCC
jgi:hypothetical protein